MRRYKTERKYYAVNMTQFNSLLLDLHVPDQVRRLGPTIFTRVRAHKCIGQIHPEGLDHSSALRHLHRDWADPCHICTGTGPTPATPAPELGPPLPHLHRNWAVLCAHAIEGYIRDAVGLAWHEGTISTRVCCKLHLVCCTALSYSRVRMCSAVCAVYSHAWMRQHAG